MLTDKVKLYGLINEIHSSDIRDLVREALNKAPECFWVKPSSSSGKYHPTDEHCLGGLVLHTLRTAHVAEILMKAYPLHFRADVIRAACILHDIARFGLDKDPSEHSLKEHPKLGAQFLETLDTKCSRHLVEATQAAIRRHMGRWGNEHPENEEDWIVHLADMIASQYIP